MSMWLLLGLVVCPRLPSGGIVGVEDEDKPTAAASTQGYVDETQQPFFGSPGQSFFEGVLSPASLERQFGADGAYYADLARCLQESPQGLRGDHHLRYLWTLTSQRLICLETFPSLLVVLHRLHLGMCPRQSRTMTRLGIRPLSLAEVAESLAVGDVVLGGMFSLS
ncbi:hypothetical protein PIB30_042076 [Stylosanthes scabra]|uniref:Uncharacterized protein n=1 Tax=Stylosanthes scabra TaxID=79078 RepID=A0ABU6QEN9_9FABA|nr:hypothetical protein [Stylosanthes scabra]